MSSDQISPLILAELEARAVFPPSQTEPFFLAKFGALPGEPNTLLIRYKRVGERGDPELSLTVIDDERSPQKVYDLSRMFKLGEESGWWYLNPTEID